MRRQETGGSDRGAGSVISVQRSCLTDQMQATLGRLAADTLDAIEGGANPGRAKARMKHKVAGFLEEHGIHTGPRFLWLIVNGALGLAERERQLRCTESTERRE